MTTKTEANTSAGSSLAAQIRSFLEEKYAEKAGLVAERDSLMERRERIEKAPLCAEDFKRALHGYIDMRGQFFLDKSAMKFIPELLYPWRQLTPTQGDQRKNMPLNTSDAMVIANGDASSLGSILGGEFNWPYIVTGGQMANAPIIENWACFWFGDQIKSKIDQHFDAFYVEPEQDASVPRLVEDRLKEIEQIAGRLGELIAQIRAIDAEVSQAIDLPKPEDPAEAEQRRAREDLARRRHAYQVWRVIRLEARNSDDLRRIASSYGVTFEEATRLKNIPNMEEPRT